MANFDQAVATLLQITTALNGISKVLGTGSANTVTALGDLSTAITTSIDAINTTLTSGLATTTYGSGPPSTLVSENSLYFDISSSPYVGYVQHSGAWNQFT